MVRVVVYDGVCNLCLAFVRFVRPRGSFEFVKYQDAEELMEIYKELPKDMSSVGFIDDGKVYLYSTAVLRVFSYLNYPAKALYGFVLVPRWIRDSVYKFIGNRRYKWFGKCECKKL